MKKDLARVFLLVGIMAGLISMPFVVVGMYELSFYYAYSIGSLQLVLVPLLGAVFGGIGYIMLLRYIFHRLSVLEDSEE